jgi:5'-phosphate synthase pdxT subunit
MILLADRILGGAEGQETFGGLDITVRRNAFGRQVDSFEGEIDFAGSPISAIFIRAPWVEEHGAQVKVLSEIDSHAVAVSQGRLLATSFHPELTTNLAVHRYFFEEICQGR